MPLPIADVIDRARRLKLVLLDVDGVLTDGIVSISSDGSESKDFFVRDGAAIVWGMRQGLELGILSGRTSEATSRRAAELGIRIVWQESPDKRRGYADILAQCGCHDHEVGYMGDDFVDLPVMTRVGLAAAPADAAIEARDAAHWISAAGGGRGAVREFLELVLRAQDKWDPIFKILNRMSRPD
jgi:3-deoxy-D-manno-octulosonate 8-phosphate phosphatase (KDO 8-P phosphatase)